MNVLGRLALTAAVALALDAGDGAKGVEFNPHKIPFLPNYNDPRPIDFDQYAGHLPLPSNGQKMFYWLVDQPLLNASEYDDTRTAARAYEFLVEFFTKYSAYYGRDFYIMGESYAGRYIPFLLHQLVTTPIPLVHLKGFAIGNPATDDKIDGNAYMDYYYTHAMISRENYLSMVANCAGEQLKKCMRSVATCSPQCEAALRVGIMSANKQQFNPYNIYGDVCLLPNSQGDALHYRPVELPRGDIGPCQDKFTQSYLQLHSVQEILHVTGSHVAWADCNHNVTRLYTRSISALPLYPTILSAGLKALIYSGDADSVVNFMGTERWIADEGLNLSVVAPWAAWIGPDKQLAGYTQQYENLTFTTVKGAGHMVAAVRPLHALYLFECFVFGKEACDGFLYPTDRQEYLSGEHNGMPLIRLSTMTRASAIFATKDGSIGIAHVAAMASLGLVVTAIVLRMYILRHRRYRYQKL
ncbi:hypothetical protein SDRG_05361 [Saprolegnia diclina VS20]|uniref:Carboxypeptidase n=1 Tax=Saprolegnia diclina (strain VS20) TaxID=1156394 RepID=T0QGN6_SAPDV|nr:hypothetical protein SDRG_05361 [Saprolegnia diclina VS20]EQC37134.1 hypothetical protein SDRG_05361 [Saprolegnia diclina VS20]|eukprot:XP_008609296.1 hypothetical protein SDRG_05361 [Saprolegnia diclina VS20]